MMSSVISPSRRSGWCEFQASSQRWANSSTQWRSSSAGAGGADVSDIAATLTPGLPRINPRVALRRRPHRGAERLSLERELDLDLVGRAVAGHGPDLAHALEQVQHVAVLGEQRRREALDALLAGALDEPAEHGGAKPATLPGIGHRDGGLGGVGPASVAEVARHREALAGLSVERSERLAVVMVDVRQQLELLDAEPLLRAEEAHVARLRAQLREALLEQ